VWCLNEPKTDAFPEHEASRRLKDIEDTSVTPEYAGMIVFVKLPSGRACILKDVTTETSVKELKAMLLLQTLEMLGRSPVPSTFDNLRLLIDHDQ
jgi:hypothetical protein